MKRSILCLTLALLLVLTLLPRTALPVSADSSGVCGDNLTWSLNPTTGQLAITGTGPMYDYFQGSNNPPWYAFQAQITGISFPDGLTRIGDDTFYSCTSLAAVTLPDSVTSIGRFAFDGCTALETLTLSANLQTIDQGAFSRCAALTALDLPLGLTSIGFRAFSNCDGLTSVVIPDSVQSLGEYYINEHGNLMDSCDVFFRCLSLESVTIGSGVEILGHDVFSECESLTSVVIPDNVRIISEGAFMGCMSLTSVQLGSGLELIGANAFSMCDLQSLVIPGNVKTIEQGAFDANSNLTELTICEGVESIGDSVFMFAAVTEVTLPESLASVGAYAFGFCMDATYQPCLADLTVLNPDCVIDADDYTLGEPGFTTLHGWEGSTAQAYAEASGYDFAALFRCPFEDVAENAYYAPAIQWALSAEVPIVAGADATHFNPNEDCTRAQIVTFLWRAAGSPEPTGTENPFRDVKDTAWYAKAVRWAAEQEITCGVSATRFDPKGLCTRAQAVTFLWRALGSPQPTIDLALPFTDVKPADYYATPVLWAYQYGITAGVSANRFGSDLPCSRAQIITFLYLACHIEYDR